MSQCWDFFSIKSEGMLHKKVIQHAHWHLHTSKHYTICPQNFYNMDNNFQNTDGTGNQEQVNPILLNANSRLSRLG